MSIRLCDCGSVCLYASNISQKPHIRATPNFPCVLPVAVIRSCSGSVAIRYVLPILWVASCFHSVDFIVRRVYS